MHFKIAKSAQSYFNNIMNLEGSHAAEDKNKFILRRKTCTCLGRIITTHPLWYM